MTSALPWRPTALCAVLVSLLLALGGAGAAPAHAASSTFCGNLVPSTQGWTCSGWVRNRWTYTSNSYNGGGSITRMRAGMAHNGGYAFTYHRFADNATFVNACWYGNFTFVYPLIGQYESSGASHTIHGRMDDSSGHSNCDPEYLT